MKNQSYLKTQYPPVRQFTADVGKINRDKHYVRTLLEVDITNPLQMIKALRAPGKKVSFLAWFIKTTADTVADHPPVNGIHKGHNTVITFKEVNVSTIVEKVVEGVSVPLPLLLKDVNHKNLFELSGEIQKAVTEKQSNLVLGKTENPSMLRLGSMLPQWLRLLFMRTFILSNPLRMQDMMGTVMVTSLGTVGRASAWIIPTSMHPLSIGIGSINKKPVVHEGAIEKREILHLTIALDHDVIDGMPAFKFVNDLVFRLEQGKGLEPV